jgi:hypothetical protein
MRKYIQLWDWLYLLLVAYFWLGISKWAMLDAIGPKRRLVAFAANGGFCEPIMTDAAQCTDDWK